VDNKFDNVSAPDTFATRLSEKGTTVAFVIKGSCNDGMKQIGYLTPSWKFKGAK